MPVQFRFRSNEALLIHIAKDKGILTLGDVAEVYDLPLRTTADKDVVMRKVKRLIELKILARSTEPRKYGWVYVNRRRIPESAFTITFQGAISDYERKKAEEESRRRS